MSRPTRQPFSLDRHGPVAILTLSADLERMTDREIETAAGPVLEVLRQGHATGLIIDVSHTDWISSFVLATLLRFYKRVVEHLGNADYGAARFVIAGASDRARELLHLTALDVLWPMYNTRQGAIVALGADRLARSSA